MKELIKRINTLVTHAFFPYLVLILITSIVYYKFFILGKIPFPGDLLVGSYSPWFDYYKIPVQNPLISDVFSQLFLWKYLSIDAFKLSQWPLWNPYSFMGTPLLATYQSATLYPLNFLLLLPKYIGWGLFISSQTLIALITMFTLLYYWTKSRLAALLGAVIFAFGGLMTTWLELGTAVHAMSWLPLCVYYLELFLEKKKLRYFILLILGLALIILAGSAQVTTYSFLIISLYYFIQSWKEEFISKISYLFLACTLAILLTAAQLLPSFDILQKSIRITESYIRESNFGLLTVKDGLRFFIADFFGNPVTRNFWGNLNYLETNGFIGTLTLPLLIYAYSFLKKSKRNLFFLILLPVSITFIFDNQISHTVYQLKIPLLTSSYASRMLFVSTFAISILSAFSLSQILENHKEQDRFLKTVIWGAAALFGILIGIVISRFLIWNTINLESSEKYLQFYLNDHEYALINYSIALRNSLLPFSLFSIFLLFFFIIRKFKNRLKIKNSIGIVCIFLVLLTILDLSRYFLKFNPFVSMNLIFPTTPALDFLKKQPGQFRIGREHAEVLPPNTWTYYNLQSYEGYDPVYLNQYGKFMHFLNGGDIRTGNSSRYAEISSNYSSPYLDAANTKFFIAILRDDHGYIPGDLLNFQVKTTPYRLIFKDRSAAILENPNALERVYFASSILTTSETKIMDYMMDDKTFDPRKKILLSKDLHIDSVTGKGSAKIEYSPNFVKLATNNSQDEVLILADQYEDGWQAEVDGKKTEISPANLIFRAVKVPSGSHEVIFKYWPKSFDTGLKVSMVTLFLITLLISTSIKFRKF